MYTTGNAIFTFLVLQLASVWQLAYHCMQIWLQSQEDILKLFQLSVTSGQIETNELSRLAGVFFFLKGFSTNKLYHIYLIEK